jgi:YHS domain-containing protein
MIKKAILVMTVVILLGGAPLQAAMKPAPVSANNQVCPVSGEKIDAAKMQPATYEYNGTIYNFCCSGCIPEFKKDPEKYIKKLHTSDDLTQVKGGGHE